MSRIPSPSRPARAGGTVLPAVLTIVFAACGPPDRPPPPAESESNLAASPVPTQDTVVSSSAPARIPFDTTDYFRVTEGMDLDSLLAGRVAGSAVVDSAVLGTRRGRRVTALLVRLGPGREPDYGWYRVYEAESTDSGRVARATQLDALGSVPRTEVGFGAVDLDADGVREPYIGHWSGGQEGYIAEVNVLDSGRRFPHWYMLEGIYSDLRSREGEFQGATPPPPQVRRWMTAHAQRVADAADPTARDPRMLHHHADIRQWIRDHGTDLRRGPVRVRWHAGPVPAVWEGFCRTRDGDVEWVTVGGIWGYDRARDRHFLLRPYGRYTQPAGVVPGVRYLWMGSTAPAGDGHGLLAYDRAARRMTVVPVAGLKPAGGDWCDEDVCGGPSLSLRNGLLYGDTVRLALPDSIVPAAEFPDTGRVCPREPD